MFRALILATLIAFFFHSKIGPLSAHPAFSHAETCSVCLKGKSADFFREINRLEQLYTGYRWTEAKIRRLYYEDLWKARYAEVDPLKKTIREEGRKRVHDLEEILKELEKESEEAVNDFWKEITALQNYKEQTSCHPENAVATCFIQDYQSIHDQLIKIRSEFEHIFESERDYRKAVALTAGSRQGLYPQDALEKPALHKEYYWRFEQERAPKRYDEDAKMMDAFHLLRELATRHIKNSACCVILETQVQAPPT